MKKNYLFTLTLYNYFSLMNTSKTIFIIIYFKMFLYNLHKH